MPYRKTEWINGETPLNADNMNNIEDGIESLETSLGSVETQLASKQGVLSSTQLQAVNSGITSTKVSKYDGYQNAINSKMDELNDSTEIVFDSANNNLHLAQSVTNKLARALVTPTQTPTEPLLVGLNASNSQTNIKIGSGLTLENGTLKSSGGSTSVGTLNTNNTTAQSVSSSESFSGEIKLHKVSKTGSYTDLRNKPSIPVKDDIFYTLEIVTQQDITSGSGTITDTSKISSLLSAFGSEQGVQVVLKYEVSGGETQHKEIYHIIKNDLDNINGIFTGTFVNTSIVSGVLKVKKLILSIDYQQGTSTWTLSTDTLSGGGGGGYTPVIVNYSESDSYGDIGNFDHQETSLDNATTLKNKYLNANYVVVNGMKLTVSVYSESVDGMHIEAGTGDAYNGIIYRFSLDIEKWSASDYGIYCGYEINRM